MHTEPRTGPIHKLVLHTNEGPEGQNTAAGLRDYLLHNGPDGGGYQVTFDDQHTVLVQRDDMVCWANGGVNHESIDGCIVGYAAQTPADWADAFDRGAIEQAAQWFAGKCRQYGIPARHLTPLEVATYGTKGICGHVDVTNAGFPESQGHTDPGPNFPWNKFIARIATLLGTPVSEPVDEEYEDMIIEAPKRQQKNPVRPACARLDLAGKKVILMNGARLRQKNLNVPATGELRGWYETFGLGGRKKGFKVMGQRDAKGENPAFEYTWA